MRTQLLGLSACLGVGCGLAPVEIDVTFPREENFLFTEFGQLLLYPVEPDGGLGDCPALLEQVERPGGGDEAMLRTERLPICQFRAGGVGFADVPPGPHAYVVLAFDDSDNILLDGCRVAEAFEGAPAVELRLFPTSEYTEATRGRTLTCGNAEDKCAAGCR